MDAQSEPLQTRILAWKKEIRKKTILGCQDSNNFDFIGAANIGDPGRPSTSRKDAELVPEAAVRPSSEDTDYHTGRGGAGNEHIAPGKEHATRVSDGAVAPKGLADKLKHKLFGSFHKK